MSKENGRIEDCVCKRGHCNPEYRMGASRPDSGYAVIKHYENRKMLIKDKEQVIFDSRMIFNSPIESCPNLPNAKKKY